MTSLQPVANPSEHGLELIPADRVELPLALCDGDIIRGDRFLREAEALAGRLPARAQVINLCAGRYRFLLTLVAAVIRGQVSLLPHSRTAAALAALRDEYPDSYAAWDEEPPDWPGATLRIRRPAALPRATPSPVPDERGVVAVVFTSGSTGRAQPHVKTWDIFRRSVDLIAGQLGVAAGPGHAMIATVPPQHMYGLETTVLLPLRSRCVLSDQRVFYPADIQSALTGLPRPRMLVTTPIHLRACLECGIRLPRTESIVSATAPLSADLARRAERRFGGVLTEIYGFTEAGSVATRRTARADRWKLFPGLRLDIVGDAARLHAPYFDVPVSLQDQVELLDERHFRWLGRLSDQVNVAGKRASLAALNAALLAVPGVQDGVFFSPSGESGAGPSVERLIAFAVAPRTTAAAVMTGLRQRIDPAFLPRPLFLVDALPRQAQGKLPREALESLAEACRRQR